MLGQITYPSKSTGDVVDNLVGNTAAAKALPLSAYQGYVLDGKIAAINNNFGNIQVATLTVTAQEASAAGQPVTIANSAYTITANFDSALSVAVPIYTWGDYTVACGDMSKDITINPDKFDYTAELNNRVYLYKDGDEYTGITGGWVAKKFYRGSTYPVGTLNKQSNCMHIYDNFYNNQTYYSTVSSVVTTKKFDISQRVWVHFIYESTRSISLFFSYACEDLEVNPSVEDNNSKLCKVNSTLETKSLENGITEAIYCIEPTSTQLHIGIANGAGFQTTCTSKIYRVWLQK